PPGSLVVSNGPRNLTAEVAIADTNLDLCKLKVESGASVPMRAAAASPKVGDKVFTLGLGGRGEWEVRQGTVRSLVSTPQGNAYDVTIPISVVGSGGPLFDAKGMLLGITTAPHSYGSNVNVVLPASWIPQMRATPTTKPAPAKAPAKKK